MQWSVGDSKRDGGKTEEAPPARSRTGWLALGGFVLVLAGATLGTLGRDRLLSLFPQQAARNELDREPELPEEQRKMATLTAEIVADVEATWTRDFAKRKQRYTPADPVAFMDRPALDCPAEQALFDSGHCPKTNKVFFDLSLAQALRARAGDKARFAWAYAVAHEMGHHVQGLIGFDVRVKDALQRRPVLDHSIGVALEVQADCLAGVWARRTTKRDQLLPLKEMENALRVISEEGRERVEQQRNIDHVETFTYAIPRRRLYWFVKGLESGDILECDPFKVE
jgi:predicted metalloprotease